jgi:CheY-like chemotaxis protein
MLPGATTILLVEDDSNDSLFMKMALEDAGVHHQVLTIPDGREALDYLEGKGENSSRAAHPLPSLILLDLKLPHVMGLDVLKAIRKKPELAKMIVIVLSASGNPQDIAAAYQLGANAYLVKPSSFEKLQAMVRALKEFWLVHNSA